MIWPLSVLLIFRLFGSAISSRVTMHGPSGQNPSKLLPRANCPPLSALSRCQSRADTSLVCRCSREHVIHRTLPADRFGALANHHGQLGLEVDLIGTPRNGNRIERIIERIARFDKQHRESLESVRGALLGVLAVIQADAENVRGNQRGEQLLDRHAVAVGNAMRPE